MLQESWLFTMRVIGYCRRIYYLPCVWLDTARELCILRVMCCCRRVDYLLCVWLVTAGELTKLERSVIGALITIDVHARDMITDMVRVQVDDASSFDWQKQLRYYWDLSLDNCVVRMSNSNYIYGYEYLGSSPRLVITPLTVSLRLSCNHRVLFFMFCIVFCVILRAPWYFLISVFLLVAWPDKPTSVTILPFDGLLLCFTVGSLLPVFDGSSAAWFGWCPSGSRGNW